MGNGPVVIIRDAVERAIEERFERRGHHPLNSTGALHPTAPRVWLKVSGLTDEAECDGGIVQVDVEIEAHEDREISVLHGLLELVSYFHGHDLACRPFVITDISFQTARLERREADMAVRGAASFAVSYVSDV